MKIFIALIFVASWIGFAECVCYSNDDCRGLTFCQKPNCDTWTGLCVPIPNNCEATTGSSVCGCDGNPYANSCHANKALVNVNGGIRCPGGAAAGTGSGSGSGSGSVGTVSGSGSGSVTTGKPGACLTNLDCGTSHYCKHPMGKCFSVGVCTAQPTVSVCHEVRRSVVCGCDYVTHNSSCAAALAGYSVVSNAACIGPHRASRK